MDKYCVAVITKPRNCIWKMLKKWPKNVIWVENVKIDKKCTYEVWWLQRRLVHK